MKKPLVAVLVALVLASLACQVSNRLVNRPVPATLPPESTVERVPTRAAPTPTPVAPARPGDQPAEQPVRITGRMQFTNDIITTYYIEHAVALTDLYGFITRDEEWQLPVEGQALGYMDLDPEAMKATYRLDLPAEPAGTLVDVDGDDQDETGVQVFAVSYSPNLTGGPYSEGDDPSFGWPSGFASIVTDPENNDELMGGRLVIWAPDGEQSFPSGFGEDGLLFTEDDPRAAVQPGYSVIDLDADPFEVLREREPVLDLFEPTDLAVKDFSELSYSEAFTEMFERIRVEYAFNGIRDKQPDWDALWEELEPRVAEAEQNSDPRAFYEALRDFTLAFKDGHVSLSASGYEDEDFSAAAAGGYGLALGELEDGRVIVIFITPGGPADEAGIRKGAVISEWDGQPIGEAIDAVIPFGGPFSTETALRYQQVRYLSRAAPDSDVEVTYQNPNRTTPQTVTLTATNESESFASTSIYSGYDPSGLPVEYRTLESGVGYIKMVSNYDDLNLVVRLFERALATFEAQQVPGLIIDMRQNPGGASLGLAGFLYDQEIPLGQLEYYSEATGQFEAEGMPDKVRPNQNQYEFSQTAILVGQACASACEIEAYGFSQVPDMIVVGMTPSAGIEAETARGQFLLPEGFSVTVPTGRFILPDGSIFLEGQGVQPTLLVEATEENLLSEEDVVLQAAEEAVLLPPGAGMEPAGSPDVIEPVEARALLEAGTPALEDRAREQYDAVSETGETYTYTVPLAESQAMLWLTGWCAQDSDTLMENFQSISYEFVLNGEVVASDQLASVDFESGGSQCRLFYTALDNWPAGQHRVETRVTFNEAINDGSQEFPAGTHVYQYDVYVKP